MQSSTLEELSARALYIRELYAQLQDEQGRQEWEASDYMMGFVKDVGDLSKLIMAAAGKREVSGLDSKIEHELADCLWSILVLSDLLEVDLERAFMETMNTLQMRLKKNQT